jgi:hypothetical protein
VSAASSALGLGGGDQKPPVFSTSVRGNDLKEGDRVILGLAAGQDAATVLTGEVQAILATLEQVEIVARSGVRKLVSARLNQVYQNQSAGQIVRDLAGQVGVTVGDVPSGDRYPYLVVDESKNVYQHLQALARREGADLFFDADDRLTVRAFTKTAADHTFYYGIHILGLELHHAGVLAERARVYGESPASAQGPDSWPWLVKDLTPNGGTVGEGTRLLGVHDGAIRTKDAADRTAKARLGAARDGATDGRLTLLGYPKIQPGDAFEIKEAPRPELNGLFKVAAVRHRFGKSIGFLTTVTFSGQGGAAAADDLLGALAGQLAGAIGL